jgi:hypothetical protein
MPPDARADEPPYHERLPGGLQRDAIIGAKLLGEPLGRLRLRWHPSRRRLAHRPTTEHLTSEHGAVINTRRDIHTV